MVTKATIGLAPAHEDNPARIPWKPNKRSLSRPAVLRSPNCRDRGNFILAKKLTRRNYFADHPSTTSSNAPQDKTLILEEGILKLTESWTADYLAAIHHRVMLKKAMINLQQWHLVNHQLYAGLLESSRLGVNQKVPNCWLDIRHDVVLPFGWSAMSTPDVQHRASLKI